MRARDLHGPVAASAFAGLLGAGIVDVLVTLARTGSGAAPRAVVALALGLYGAAALVAGAALGALAGAVTGAIPGGWSSLRGDRERDQAAAAGVLAGLVGVLVLAIGAAAGQRVLIGK